MIHIQSNSTSLLISQPLTLFCIVTGYPLVDISWNNNSVPIQSNANIAMETVRVTDISGLYVPQELLNANITNIPNIMDIGSVGLLRFKNVTRADTANYSCVATNMLQDTGKLTAESGLISITVLGKSYYTRHYLFNVCLLQNVLILLLMLKLIVIQLVLYLLPGVQILMGTVLLRDFMYIRKIWTDLINLMF